MIRDVLDKLSADDLAVLRYAHQNELSQHVRLPDGHFVGVFINSPQLIKEEVAGDWSYGKIRSRE
tara:strand:+ start:11364 stop:11558 length:195 start_codon:yes stop_codon:yes gene_type:complete